VAQIVVTEKPDLYVHVGGATHFLRWELPEFQKYFNIVKEPSDKTILISFGPDILEEASKLPALERFAVLFPGFGHNPLYNNQIKKIHFKAIKNFKGVFINPGPLEIAYHGLKNIYIYPFSVDTNLVKLKRYRNRIKSLIHVSNDGLQKDWERSESIMKLTKMKYEVYPPRNSRFYDREVRINNIKNKLRSIVNLQTKIYLPHGYVSHEKVIKKYQKYDGFVHVARDIKHQVLIDGKYTASLIEAGLTGSILFWHDTFSLGNSLKTVFSVPLDPDEAAEEIKRIAATINVKQHSKDTRREMLETFNPVVSVKIRADIMLSLTESLRKNT
jgi:hypothetical protein